MGASRILYRQLPVRLAVISAGPLVVLLVTILAVAISRRPPGERLDTLLGAATTFAFKRNEVHAAHVGAISWLVLSAPLEAWTLGKEPSTDRSGRHIVAWVSSWSLSFALAIAWALLYQSMLAHRV
jgi:hypothetical protein